uniref:Kinase n=1 Tax=Hirondellea gigas TaxID=1518452 RepID=A0A2P2I5M4_9CRUS
MTLSLLTMSATRVEYHRSRGPVVYSDTRTVGATLSVKGFSEQLVGILQSIESCSCDCSHTNSYSSGTIHQASNCTHKDAMICNTDHLNSCVEEVVQDLQLQQQEEESVKDSNKTPDLEDILCRILRQVAGSQREQDLKEFFQSIRKSKEPHINEENNSSKYGDSNESTTSRRHSLSKIWRKHSKKRRKKDVGSEDSADPRANYAATERLTDKDVAATASENKSNESAGATEERVRVSQQEQPPCEDSRLPVVPADGASTTTPAAAAGAVLQQEDGSFIYSTGNENMSMLQKLAFNALHLTAPASSLLLHERRNSWVQLSGHPGSLAPAGPGTIWKKRDPESTETVMYQALMDDSANSIVPTFFKEIHYGDDYFIEMRDLLSSFHKPSIMDVKMGTRTFLEGEVSNTKPRPDLYDKMVKVSPEEPTAEEREARAVTKLRYMAFRDNLSSSRHLGFRVEAMKTQGGATVTDMKKVSTRDEVMDTMTTFMRGRDSVRRNILEKLLEIRETFENSPFFATHEIIGSSILIVYDDEKAGVWIIDFAKARLLPEGISVTHRKPWILGNHEEGFLFGLDNIIHVVEEVKVNKNKKLNFLRKC